MKLPFEKTATLRVTSAPAIVGRRILVSTRRNPGWLVNDKPFVGRVDIETFRLKVMAPFPFQFCIGPILRGKLVKIDAGTQVEFVVSPSWGQFLAIYIVFLGPAVVVPRGAWASLLAVALIALIPAGLSLIPGLLGRSRAIQYLENTALAGSDQA